MLGHFIAQGEVSPTRHVGRVDDDARARIEGTRGADSNAMDFLASSCILREKAFDRGEHRSESILGATAAIHGSASLREDLAKRVNNAGRDLCSADIYTDDLI